jgi:heterotetrameric sarcosine oxidase gamma subunit
MLDKTGHVASPERRSPLSHREALASSDGSTHLMERPFVGKLIVRGQFSQIVAVLEAEHDIILPSTACTSSVCDRSTVLWLGPSEWMLLVAEGEEKGLLDVLEKALTGIHHQTVDVTDYYTVIRLSGIHSRIMVAKLTTLDLHSRSFPPGAVKGSIFGRVPAILHRPDEHEDRSGAIFDLIIRWSHADYLWCLLALAGREHGFPEQTPKGQIRLAAPRS